MFTKGDKLFAVVKDGIVVDGWFAKDLEEAQKDNPDCLVIECTLENSPWNLGDNHLQVIERK